MRLWTVKNGWRKEVMKNTHTKKNELLTCNVNLKFGNNYWCLFFQTEIKS